MGLTSSFDTISSVLRAYIYIYDLYLPSSFHEVKDVIGFSRFAPNNRQDSAGSPDHNRSIFTIMESSTLPGAPPRKPVFQRVKHAVTTRDGLIGSYDYAALFRPNIPFLRRKGARTSSPFFGLHDRMPVVLSALLGFQHALAMLAGVITPPILLSGQGGANLTTEEQQYLVSTALIVSGILSAVQITRFHIFKTPLVVLFLRHVSHTDYLDTTSEPVSSPLSASLSPSSQSLKAPSPRCMPTDTALQPRMALPCLVQRVTEPSSAPVQSAPFSKSPCRSSRLACFSACFRLSSLDQLSCSLV